MGCDIHIRAEVKRFGQWEAIGQYWPNPYIASPLSRPDEELICEPLKFRNYEVFAAFAGVRNSGTVIPISEPRGLPTDISYDAKCYLTQHESDRHSASWLTLEELESYDWGNIGFSRDGQGGWFFELIDRLKELEGWERVEGVRIVFNFDS